MGDTRINARLDEEAQKQIKYLVQATGRNTSHVVREAIAVYHAQVRQNRPIPKRLLAMAGKYRSVDGRSDVSVNYKDLLTDSLMAKHSLGPYAPAALKKSPKAGKK
jgi:Arc/MetJ-type ribon-helix-helix transcriptional regulator